ncbi:MAG: CocE/NonD family hydrolase [bacterium]|nr:CocE/NonD family hydrolase [bacterium]
MRRQIPVALLLLFTPAMVVAGLDDFQVKAVGIPMADGATLAADVYLPGAGRYPTILTITMSSKKQAVTKFFPRTAAWSSGDYALVCVERRGSAGSADNPRRQGINPDGWDGHDVVEWIAGQPWSDGKVGMWGASNQGKIQSATAMTNPPHLVAIMPAETRSTSREYRSIGLVYDAVYPGGVLRLEMLQNALGDEQRKAGQPGVGMAAMARKHALDDGFFERRPEGAPTLADVKVPVMVVGSWFDNDINRASTELFLRLLAETDPKVRRHHRLLIGPWTHNGVYSDAKQGQLQFPGAAAFYQQREKQYFDYWLRGIDNSEAEAPPVAWYQMGENEWRTARTWPPAGVREVAFHVHGEGKLARNSPAAKSAPASFRSDPDNPVPTVGGQNKQKRFGKGPHDQSAKVESHPDVLLFTTGPLERDLPVAGDVRVRAFVSSDAEDTDVAFRLTDVFPDGRSMLLRDGILRMSLRDSRKRYEFLSPGEIYEGTIATIPLAWTFRKGHRVRLIISASNYPRYDVNTNRREKTGEPAVAVNELYRDADHPSALLLPVVE